MSKKRKKVYRPKPVGAPIGKAIRDQLVLPAYSSLTVLQSVSDVEAVDSAWNTLTAFFNYLYVARTLNGADSDEAQSSLAVLKQIRARLHNTGTLRATGPELTTLKAGVAWGDSIIGSLRTDLIQRAVAMVDEELFNQREVA